MATGIFAEISSNDSVWVKLFFELSFVFEIFFLVSIFARIELREMTEAEL